MCKLRGEKKHLKTNKITLPPTTKTIQKTYLYPKWGEEEKAHFFH